MADRKILKEWFDKINGDVQFLQDCLVEVLEEVGRGDLAKTLSQLEHPESASEALSIELVGSSKTMMLGSSSTARAIATAWR